MSRQRPVIAATPAGVQDQPTVDAAWNEVGQPAIEGLRIQEIRPVPADGRTVTEVFRRDWGLADLAVDHVFQSLIAPGEVVAWHVHRETTDCLFVGLGLLKAVLYDGRPRSASFGAVRVVRLGAVRPRLLVIPPGVWHGVANIGAEPALLINVADLAYRYANPDHWRLPWDSDQIPYRFRP